MTNQPICSAVVAMAPNHTIGGCNELLWRAPKDLKHFKSLTVDHAIIMGRKTFESIGRKLPRRHTIVVTSKPAWEMPDVEIAAACKRPWPPVGVMHPSINNVNSLWLGVVKFIANSCHISNVFT
jgi:Dihydrofolate reductase